MKISCGVIGDLLPLYAEGLLSDDSVELVKSHIQQCGECEKELETMNQETSKNHVTPEKYKNYENRDPFEDPDNPKKQENSALITDTGPLKKIRRKIFYGKMKWTLLAILGSLVITILLVTYVTAPNYLPYDEERVAVIEGGDNKVYLEFGEDVAGYDIEPSGGLSGNHYEYRITTWDTLWNQTLGRSETSMVVLNPEGNQVSTIFYYTTDGQLDQVIYGTNPHPDGGSLTLPRLALNYYGKLAAFCLLLAVIFWKLSRKQRIRRFFEVAAMLSGSYVLAQGILHGLSATTYSMLRDFTEILLLAVTIFIILLVVQNILRIRRKTYT